MGFKSGMPCKLVFSVFTFVVYIRKSFCLTVSRDAIQAIGNIAIEKVVSDSCELVDVKQDLMDVAVYRNKLIDADMKIASQESKRDEYNRVEAGLTGLSIGLAGGLTAGGLIYFSSDDSEAISSAVQTAIGIGAGLGLPLGLSNALGNKVYVPTMEQARRGLVQDFTESIWRGGNVAFVARSNDLDGKFQKFKPSNGVVAVIETQIRNFDGSSKKFGSLPCHVHIMNLDVDNDLRRNGLATKLMNKVELYTKRETDADLLTLLVDDTNDVAISLYKKLGFDDPISIGAPSASKEFGSFTIGRSIMMKRIR